MKQTHAPRTQQSDNLGVILEGWSATLRILAVNGNPYALAWLPIISAERTVGGRLAAFVALRCWLLGVPQQRMEALPPPPSADDWRAEHTYSLLFGSHT